MSFGDSVWQRRSGKSSTTRVEAGGGNPFARSFCQHTSLLRTLAAELVLNRQVDELRQAESVLLAICFDIFRVRCDRQQGISCPCARSSERRAISGLWDRGGIVQRFAFVVRQEHAERAAHVFC